MSGEKYAFMNKSEVLWFFGALVAVVGFLALFTKNPAQEASTSVTKRMQPGRF